MTQSKIEALLELQMRVYDLPAHIQQYRMPEHPERKWAFDFCFPDARLLIEVNGGTWVANTGHSSGRGIERDTEKLCTAVAAGYRVLTVTTMQVKDGRAIRWIRLCLEGEQ
jgi:very-short-patch-repair endonuclease